MYNFIFYFIYKSQINQKNGGPVVAKFMGGLFVLLVLLIHALFIYAIFRFVLFNYYGIDISFSIGKGYIKKWLFSLALIIMIMPFIKRSFTTVGIERIQNKFESQNIFTFVYFVKFFVILLLPLIISIFLVNHSLAK